MKSKLLGYDKVTITKPLVYEEVTQVTRKELPRYREVMIRMKSSLLSYEEVTITKPLGYEEVSF